MRSCSSSSTSNPYRTYRPQHPLGRLLGPSSPGLMVLLGLLVAASVALGLKGLTLSLERLEPGSIHFKDFAAMYLLAKAVATGADPFLPLPALAERFLSDQPAPPFTHPTPHPPTLGLLVLPLAYLDYATAATAWVVIELACLVGALLVLRHTTGRRLPVWATLVLALALVAWFPVWHGIQWGQVSLLLLLLLSLMLLAVRARRSIVAGGLLGLSLLVKPLAWPLLVLLALRGERRAVVGALLPILLVYAATTWLVGVDRILVYFTQVLPAVTRIYERFLWNLSVWTIGRRLFQGTDGIAVPPLIESDVAARLTSLAIPALLLLLAGAVTRQPMPLDWAIAVMVCLSIVISPLAWPHYLVLALLPAALVLNWLIRHNFPVRETNLALAVMALLLVGYAWWEDLAFLVAGQTLPASGGEASLPFAPALLTFAPTLGVGALGWLSAWLGWREQPLTSTAIEKR